MNRGAWMTEVEELLVEQHFRYDRCNNDQGLRVFPKAAGEPAVVLYYPGADRHSIQNVFSSLRRVGVDVSSIDGRPQKPKEHNNVERISATHASPQAVAGGGKVPSNGYELIRHHIDQAVSHLADAQEVLNKLEGEGAKMNQLRALLREAL